MNFKFDNPDRVNFQAEGHKYTNGRGQKYTSVTTVLKDYEHEFDGDYWSTYKAVKFTLENINLFHEYKKRAGGWRNVVDYFRKNYRLIDAEVRQRIFEKKQWYLDKWEDERVYAAKKGNEHHNDLEQLMLSSKKVKLGKRKIANVSPADLLDLQGFTDGAYSLYPELLIWNDHFRLAGQADVVEREEKKVHIKDYKTCKKIDFEPFMDTRMHEPLDTLPDMNYSKFTMQLSTYGWMLEQIGYEVVGLTMIHIDRETGKHIKDYPLAYRPDLVIKMLEHHASKGIRESIEKHT